MFLLELRGIAKFFGHKCVFKAVDLVVERGTVTLLVGANGAGKSTLLRLMAGLSRPSAGSRECRAAEGRTAYLGHATFLYPGLTALENLAFWRDAQGLRLTEAELTAFLDRVGLSRHAHERAGIFSRGMAQRLNLARALLTEPELLLLDEPGTGLDSRASAMLREEIVRARMRGAGLVWISHDAATDAPLADRVLTLERGRLSETTLGTGTPC
ncbi:MAG: ATP-binding cassette domain-containing protein [Deltaproteobacteria bacterium]|jgi:heme exporter protein A|nr:ATP-binding cassette domain-containing protein [Deltaproteobacteria bacterium]